MTVVHTTKTVYGKDEASLTDTVASPARLNIDYLIAIVYGRFNLTIVRVKRPYTIGVKYLTSQAKLPCPAMKLHLICTPCK